MKALSPLARVALTMFPLVATAANPIPTRPNVVMIMVDDLDALTMKILLTNNLMPNFQTYIGQQAVEFRQSFVVNPLCAPSRATFLTGRYTHNHGVYTTGKWNGTVLAFDDSSTLPVWLQQAGYKTGHVGKYINGYGMFSQLPPSDLPTARAVIDVKYGSQRRAAVESAYVPPGWNEWYGLLDSWTYCTQNYAMNENGTVTFYREDGSVVSNGAVVTANTGIAKNYQTDVLALKATKFLDRSTTSPFFLSIAPLAPHIEECGIQNTLFGDTGSSLQFDNYDSFFQATIRPAPRHIAFANALLPFARQIVQSQPTFNEPDYDDKPLELRENRGQLTAAMIEQVSKQFADRAASMLSVDNMIGKIGARLAAAGALNNTVILFTTDNGWSYGQHRLSSKVLAYEESVRAPLYVRLPGKIATSTPEPSDRVVLNTDLAPTIAQLAGATWPASVDGRSFVPLLANPATPTWRKRFLVEHYLSAWQDEGSRPSNHYSMSAVRTTDEDTQARQKLYTEYFAGMQLREGWYATRPAFNQFSIPLTAPHGPHIMLTTAIDGEFYDTAADPYEEDNLLFNVTQRPDAQQIETERARMEAWRRQFVTCAGPSCRSLESQ